MRIDIIAWGLVIDSLKQLRCTSIDWNGLGGDASMSDSVDTEHDEDPNEPVPLMQRVLDNPFLLLFLGVTVPAVLYIIWGVMEIIAIPIAR